MTEPTDLTTAAAAASAPRLGDLVLVRAAAGMSLANNETGGLISCDVDTPQTVTLTLLRRLADADLVLVAGRLPLQIP